MCVIPLQFGVVGNGAAPVIRAVNDPQPPDEAQWPDWQDGHELSYLPLEQDLITSQDRFCRGPAGNGNP